MTSLSNKSCSVDGCPRLYDGKTAKGLCRPHYAELRASSEYRIGKPTCSVSKCGRLHTARGYCRLHWERWKHHGSPGSADLILVQHRMSHTPTYRVWAEMRRRCSDTGRQGYKNYGGRGIKVCERWLDYTNFLADMGERPNGLSLDRKDNDGNYEPDNCRWATRHQQVLNRRGHGASKFRGVHRTSGRKGVWRAAITPRAGVIITLGYFTSEHQAALAWNMAAMFIYGEDANPNQILMLPSGIGKSPI